MYWLAQLVNWVWRLAWGITGLNGGFRHPSFCLLDQLPSVLIWFSGLLLYILAEEKQQLSADISSRSPTTEAHRTTGVKHLSHGGRMFGSADRTPLLPLPPHSPSPWHCTAGLFAVPWTHQPAVHSEPLVLVPSASYTLLPMSPQLVIPSLPSVHTQGLSWWPLYSLSSLLTLFLFRNLLPPDVLLYIHMVYE